MKVTVKNPSKKPVNISKLAPLMPVMVLGVNQEIIVNVRDIDSVTKNAKKIGVTVTPVGEAFPVTEATKPEIVETTSKVEEPETDKKETEVEVETLTDTPTETNENTPEMVEQVKVDEVVEEEVKTEIETEKEETKVEEKPKKARKSAKAKKVAKK